MDNGIFEKFRKETYVAEDGYSMPYRLYIPDNYDCGEEYPLVFFLHGAGERGDDNEKQLAIGIRHMFWEGSPAYNAIIAAPQCACDKRWVDIDWDYGVFHRKQVKETRELQTAMLILKEVMEFCNVDRDRVYVTGISMGGYGTFDALARHGSTFAAGVPVCGGCDPDTDAKANMRIPLWMFHGSADTVVPPVGSRLMYAKIRSMGGDKVRYTEYSGMNHGIWDNAYSDREMVLWMFAQSRYERRMLAEKRAKQKKAAMVAGGVGIAAVAAAVIAGQVVKKIKKSAQVTIEPMKPIAALPAAEEPAPQKPEAKAAPEKEVQVQIIKTIKPIKKPKADKTKAMLDKAASRAVDMTVQVIRKLADI